LSRLVSRLSIDDDRLNWRVLAAVTAVILLFVAVVSVILTAPVSELKVFVRNTDESDTARVTILLGESATSLNILPGELLVWKFHVSPGTHALSASCSHDDQLNADEDFTWTMQVGFMGMSYYWIHVSEEGTSLNSNPPSLLEGSHPLSQALKDLNVVAPAAVLSGLVVLVVVTLWNLFRIPPQTNPKRPTGPP